MGSRFKLLAKVLANRLKKGVSLPQNVFVEGRKILNTMLIAKKVLDSVLRSNETGVLCKLDIKNTYDHINWNLFASW